MCLQETEWVGEKSRSFDSGYKLWLSGRDQTRNGVSVNIDDSPKEEVVGVKRKGDQIIAIKLVHRKETLDIFSNIPLKLDYMLSPNLVFGSI